MALLPLGSVTRCPTRFGVVAKRSYTARAAADFKRRTPPLRREADADNGKAPEVKPGGIKTLPSLTAPEGIQLTETTKHKAMLWKAALKIPLCLVPVVPIMVSKP